MEETAAYGRRGKPKRLGQSPLKRPPARHTPAVGAPSDVRSPKNPIKRRSSKVADEQEFEEHNLLTETLFSIKTWILETALHMKLGDEGYTVLKTKIGNFDLQAVREIDVNGDEVFVLEADEIDPGVHFVQALGEWKTREKVAYTFMGDLREALYAEEDDENDAGEE